MALGGDKTRILVNVPIELKEKIELEAQKENRSISNYIVNILIKLLEEKEEE